MDPILELKFVTKYFNTYGGLFKKGHRFSAVNNVTFSLDKSSILGIVGESGSGKSTIARLICSIYNLDSGEILYNGHNIHKLNKAEFKDYRKNIQMVFQDPNNSLNPKLKIKSALSDGIKEHITKNKGEIEGRLESLMDMVGLSRDYLNRYPHEFSGGQRQRIAIARALSIEPNIIIADEPVSSLDVSVQAQILNLMKELQETGLTIILISHSLAVVSNLCDNTAVMKSGDLVEFGETTNVLGNPQTDYTKNLLKASEYTNIF